MGDDIPSLSLRVLEKIQAELVTMRENMNSGFARVATELEEVRDEVRTLNTRFDHFLAFVGKDVQDLKTRVTALEQSGRP
jgi:hypothetical protein